MELTKEQLKSIKEQVSSGAPLEDVLLHQFPNSKISIIRGYDHFSYEAYTMGAFFGEEWAKEFMEEIPCNGTLADTYHIVTGTVNDLNEGKLNDTVTGDTLEKFDIERIYSKLKRSL